MQQADIRAILREATPITPDVIEAILLPMCIDIYAVDATPHGFYLTNTLTDTIQYMFQRGAQIEIPGCPSIPGGPSVLHLGGCTFATLDYDAATDISFIRIMFSVLPNTVIHHRTINKIMPMYRDLDTVYLYDFTAQHRILFNIVDRTQTSSPAIIHPDDFRSWTTGWHIL